MKRIENRKATWTMTLSAGLIAGLGATFALLPQARGELVYETPAEETAAEPTQNTARVDDRDAMRQAIGASERARTTVQAEQPVAQPAPVPVQRQVVQTQAIAAPVVVQQQQPVVQQQPVAQMAPAPVAVTQQVMPAYEPAPVADLSTDEVKHESRAEMLRRARMREELRNEDALQSRLEELRLRDEKRRTDTILGNGEMAATGEGTQAPAVQEQAIVSPVTEHPGQPVTSPAPVATVASVQGTNASDQQGMMGVSTAVSSSDESDKTVFALQPRLGMSNMKGDSYGYEVKPRFAAGIGANVATSDNVSFELGYTYAEYGVAMASSNPFVQQVQYANPYNNGSSPETVALKQNIFDAGVKLSLLGSESKVRPFIGGGGAYAKSYVNYDDKILSAINANPGLAQFGRDYELQQYLGYVSGGLDVKMSKSMTVGLLAKYYAVLSSRENNPLNNYGFGYGYGNGYNPGVDMDKQFVGGSLAKAGFYSIMGGLSFVF